MSPEELRRAILEVRRANLRSREETRPRMWRKRDRMVDGPGTVYYLVIDAGGCRWAMASGGCSMCGYIYDTCARKVREEEIVAQANRLLSSVEKSTSSFALRLFTSGSFLDEREIPRGARDRIVEMVSHVKGLRELTFESRPEFVSAEAISSIADRMGGVTLEVALGLETANDKVRESCIGKGFSFTDYLRAAREIRSAGARVKTYVLIKPPFLSEFDSYFDALATTRRIVDVTDSISYNACNVQKGTLVERLYREGKYRPPWIWTVVEVLKSASRMVVPGETLLISDTLAFGTPRGPHNCGRCDRALARVIEKFTLTQDADVLSQVQCSCRGAWAKIYNYHF